MRASFDGPCRGGCGGRVRAGEPVRKAPGGGVMCERCALERDGQQRLEEFRAAE